MKAIYLVQTQRKQVLKRCNLISFWQSQEIAKWGKISVKAVWRHLWI